MTRRQWWIAAAVGVWWGLIEAVAEFVDGSSAFVVTARLVLGASQVLVLFGVVAVLEWLWSLGDGLHLSPPSLRDLGRGRKEEQS